MRPEEQTARDLYAVLEPALAGTNAGVMLEGRGVQWRIDVKGERRSCRIHCFHYGSASGGLVLGMRGNAHLSRVGRFPKNPPPSGPEYLVVFEAADEARFDGRDAEPVIVTAAVRDWVVAELSASELYEKYSFIDAARRGLREIGDRVDAHLGAIDAPFRAIIEQPISPELWVYGDGRSCHLVGLGESVGCGFLLDRAELARGEITRESIGSVVAAWLCDRISLAELVCRLTELEVSPFAELYERGNIAGWHWANVLDQAESPGSVLYDFVPLLQRIVDSPIARRFYSYTSLDRLCFSSSSHYPFADRGLPVLRAGRAENGESRFWMQAKPGEQFGTAGEIAAALESALRAAPIAPFHGTIDDPLIEPLNYQLRRRDSALVARRVQRCQWFDVVVTKPVASGERRCVLSVADLPWHVNISFRDRDRIGSAEIDGVDAIVDALELWLERETSPSELASELSTFTAHAAQPRKP